MTTYDLFSATSIPSTPLTDNEKFAWLRLIRSENIGPITFYRLLERFGTASSVIEQLPSLSKRSAQGKPISLAPMPQIEKEINDVHKYGASLLYAGSEGYPLALSAIDDAPPVLTVMGDVSYLNKSSVGIVGSRNASLNGRKFAEILARELGEKEQLIVSGLARGIDTSAHKGALQTGTIAVIAGGIDVIYPEENKDLYKTIAEIGAIVAESPFGQVPYAQSFPKRNRIISGLSAGVVIVEASLRSGSLITARFAAEQGRDVFAVPGFPMDPRAQGPNKLLQDGAVLVQNAEDILRTLGTFHYGSLKGFKEPVHTTSSSPTFAYEENEQVLEDAHELLLAKLSTVPIQIDHLLRDTGLSISAFNSVLLELELTGQIQRHTGGRISL